MAEACKRLIKNCINCWNCRANTIQMPPGGRRPVGHRLQQFLPFGRIIDLSEFLRQIQVIGSGEQRNVIQSAGLCSVAPKTPITYLPKTPSGFIFKGIQP
jgi:hypothetical protein